MPNKTYTSGTVVDSSSLNDFNDITYEILGDGTNAPTTKAAARTNLGLGTLATQDANAVAITGGSITGITDLAIAEGGTGASTAAGARANLGIGSVYSFRNKLINSLGLINQRAYASASATVTANQYTLDRWRVVTLGQALTFTTALNVTTMTAPTGGLEQVIEGNNIEGGVYTLSWIGTATATVNGVAIANGAQTASLPAGTDVTIRFITGTVAKPQFEAGTVVTTFEQRPFPYELSLCQQYYQTSYEGVAAGTPAAADGRVISLASATSAYVVFSIWLKTNMRVTPTVQYYNPSTGALNGIRNETAGTNFGIFGGVASKTSLFVQSSTAPPASATMTTHFTASAEL